MRIALGLEYNGTSFCGWQSQPNGCGVQDALEVALAEMAGHALRVTAAGRTDAGVHALHQVIHFDTQTLRPISAWVRGVNAKLPASLRVLWASEVADNFSARFDATSRRYQYLLINSSVAPAVLAGRAGWFHLALDEKAMQQAASHLIGEHDFSAFRAAECQAKSPVKLMHEANVSRQGESIIFEFCAGAFLHHQVRNMVGALIYIGKGNHRPGYMLELLESRDRTLAPPTFSPDGLYLTGVTYDKKWNLPNAQRRLSLLI